MSYNLLLVVTVSCLLVGSGRGDAVNDAVDQSADVYDKTKDFIEGLSNTADDNTDNYNNMNNQASGVWCWECTIQKQLDNQVISIWDEVLHEKVSTGVCKEYQCASGLDWCLVTHFRVRAADGGSESKRERYECGNSNQRERDTRCQLLLQEDKDHQVIESCTTKRSGASSIYTIYISAFLAAVLLYVH